MYNKSTECEKMRNTSELFKAKPHRRERKTKGEKIR